MSFCDEIDNKICSSTGCCGTNCTSGKGGCAEARIPLCNCQSNVGCLDRGPTACSGLRTTGTAVTGACPGPCQCVEEEIWNSNLPPKPNCRWLNNFAELRRQWSDHGRQQAYKCHGCSRSCRTVASCRPSLLPTPQCPGTILLTSDCQKCCGSRRLAGGASKSEMAPVDKSSSPVPLKREASGGCPPPSCSYPSTRYNSSNADCSFCCPSPCRYPQASHRASDCQPCALKSILKKRSCCQCNTSCCLCQPIPRGCNCPPPIQVDARAAHECSCDCPSSPECACPPSERRFPKTIKCPNARLCCPSPRLPSGPKCHCPRCQSCPPPPCDPCPSTNRRPVPLKNPCRPGSPCPSCPPCRPVSITLPCRSSTPCRKLTFCTEHNNRPSSPCTGQSWREIIDDKSSESSVCSEQNDNERREIHDKKDRDYCCATECAGFEDKSEHVDENHNLILNEGSTQNSTSKTFINLSEITNPSKSVDPDSRDMPEERDEAAFGNAAETLEGCTTEKSSKDSWHTSPTHASSENGAKPDRNVSHEEYSSVGGNASGNSVLARLSSRMKSLSRVKDLSAPNKMLLRHSVTFRDTSRARIVPCFNKHPNHMWDRQTTRNGL